MAATALTVLLAPLILGLSLDRPSNTILTIPPCVTEDSDDCYWDALTMGDRTGSSFINLGGSTYYLE